MRESLLRALPVWTYVEAVVVVGIWVGSIVVSGWVQVVLIVVGILATVHFLLTAAMFIGAEMANRALAKFQKDVNAGVKNPPKS